MFTKHGTAFFLNRQVRLTTLEMNTMKPSRYNYFVRVNDKVILAYNTMTTALFCLSNDEFRQVEMFCMNPQPLFFEENKLSEFGEQLANAGFLVPDEEDELERIRVVRQAIRQESRHLSLTVVPTLGCNFRCTYCFSFTQPKRMSSEVQQSLVHFVDDAMCQNDSLSVAWFGGEPTLCLDIIDSLSAQLSSLCNGRGVKMLPGSMVTNGYLLNEETARHLKSNGIARAQVTLDGDKITHDKRRPLRNGLGTFDRILENLANTCDILELQIRINIDKTNVEAATGALDALKASGLERKVAISFGHVKSYTQACADVESNCFSSQEFSEQELKLTQESLARGFTSLPYPQLLLGGGCAADKANTFVIAPDGLLFKCWAEASVGETWSIGHLLQPGRTCQQEQNLQQYLTWDPTSHINCQDCCFLPICMGGCPHEPIRHKSQVDCNKWRYTLPQILALRYLLMGKISSDHVAT